MTAKQRRRANTRLPCQENRYRAIASNAVLVLSALVEIDQVGNGHYIVAIKNSVLLLDPFQHRRREIAPTQLRGEPVPDDQVAFIETTPFFETPLQDLFISSALDARSRRSA